MSATLTLEQDGLLDDLLRAGRWRSKSEIIGHGLELVRAEVARADYTPLSDAERAAAYAGLSAAELAADKLSTRARHYPTAKDLA